MASIQQLLQDNSPDETFLKVSVVDSGSGMDPTSSTALFNLFGKVKLSED